jgi:hypothetical protein
MSKIHVLPDENLGGVLREYVEVDRIARVGDYVTKDGYVRKVSSRDTHFGNTVEFDEYYKGETGDDVCGWVDGYYKTLEPTDILHVDGERYRLVDRKAKVGEKVIVTNALKGERDNCPFDNGYVSTVISAGKRVITVNPCAPLYHHEYRVLEPVEPAENELVTAEEGDPKSTLDLLANLARRVTELERKLGETNKSQESSETHIFDVIHRIQNEIDGMYDKYREIDDKIEMILDDIVALDERTQPLVALVKAVRGNE